MKKIGKKVTTSCHFCQLNSRNREFARLKKPFKIKGLLIIIEEKPNINRCNLCAACAQRLSAILIHPSFLLWTNRSFKMSTDDFWP